MFYVYIKIINCLELVWENQMIFLDALQGKYFRP